MPNVPACPSQDDDDATRNAQGAVPSNELVPLPVERNTAPIIAPVPPIYVYAYVRERIRGRSSRPRRSGVKQARPLPRQSPWLWRFAAIAAITVAGGVVLHAGTAPRTTSGTHIAAAASRHETSAATSRHETTAATSRHETTAATSRHEATAAVSRPASVGLPIPAASATEPPPVASATVELPAPGYVSDAVSALPPPRRIASIIDVVTADMVLPEEAAVKAPLAAQPARPAAISVQSPATARAPAVAAASTAPPARPVAKPATKPAAKPAAKAGTPASVKPSMQASPNTPSRPVTAAKGRTSIPVTIAVRPWGEILVDGQSRGISPPMRRLTLAAGTYDITIRNNMGPDVHQRLTVGADNNAAISHTFQ